MDTSKIISLLGDKSDYYLNQNALLLEVLNT